MGNQTQNKQTIASILVLLGVMLDVCHQSFGHSVFFKVKEAVTSLPHGKKIADVKDLHELYCHFLCAHEKICIWVDYDGTSKMCKLFAESASHGEVQFGSEVNLSEKVPIFNFFFKQGYMQYFVLFQSKPR